jgi:hypothetical protein
MAPNHTSPIAVVVIAHLVEPQKEFLETEVMEHYNSGMASANIPYRAVKWIVPEMVNGYTALIQHAPGHATRVVMPYLSVSLE